MVRTFLHATLALTLFAAGAQAAQIVVWEHPAFRGASAEFDGGIRSLIEVGWNDRISSLRVDSGRWELCRETDFRNCRTLTAEEIDSLETGWNDAISSIRPVIGITNESANVVARRLYRGILGREPDPEGLRNAAAEIQGDRVGGLIQAMLKSAEYRNLRAQRSSAEILDQLYRAILGRPADTTARRNYLARLDRGEDAQVVFALVSSEEYGSGDLDVDEGDTSTLGRDIVLEASGAGLAVWGANGRYESITGANVTLGRDGRAEIELTGFAPQTFTGTWTRESQDVARLSIPQVGARRLAGEGFVMLDNDELARVEIVAGTPGSRSSAVLSFIADEYLIPSGELECYQEVRQQLEEEREAPLNLLFLAPERSRVASGRAQLNGDALILADPGRLEYRCEVDTRRGTLLDARAVRR